MEVTKYSKLVLEYLNNKDLTIYDLNFMVSEFVRTCDEGHNFLGFGNSASGGNAIRIPNATILRKGIPEVAKIQAKPIWNSGLKAPECNKRTPTQDTQGG